MNINVHELRKQGYKVRIKHFRKYYNIKDQKTRGEYERDTIYKYSAYVLAKGGETRVELTSPNGQEFVGIAKCSKKENYNRRKGVTIAFGRIFSTHGHKMVN